MTIGLLYTGRFNDIYSHHAATLSANLRPAKWVEMNVNTTASTTAWVWGAALSLKAKHFNVFIGSDDFLGKVSKQGISIKNTNANVSMGMTFSL